MISPNEPVSATSAVPVEDAALDYLPHALDELRRARESLRQSQHELRALADSMPQLAWIAEQDGAMIWYNQRWYDYTGTTPQDMLDDGWRRVYAPDCIDALDQMWDQCRA